LAGREEELEFMMGFLGEAISGKGTLVLLSGEAGIGKTRLVEEFRSLAVSTGCRFLLGDCLPGAPSPYLPFYEAFQRCVAAKVVDVSFLNQMEIPARISRTMAPRTSQVNANGPGMDAAASRKGDSMDADARTGSERVLFSTLQALREISVKRPVVLCIEDLHWADSASVQLLHFLARNSSGLRVLLIGTYRPEDVRVDAMGGAHPLLETLRIMRREEVCHEIGLSVLNIEEMRIAIESMLGGLIEHDLLQRIWTESGGNPLFAIETVRLLVSTKSIAFQSGMWKIVATTRMDIPPTVKEVISRRIEKLPRSQRRILDCAAVVGDCFDSEVLEGALGLNRLALLEDLDYIEKDYQIIHENDGRYRFDHEKTKRVIYDQISPPRRRELHRIIGEMLESRLPNETLYGELSAHFLNANIPGKCSKYSLSAGESCIRRYAMPEAIPYFQRVVDIAKEATTDNEALLKALEGLGIANEELCNYQSALLSFDEFLRLSTNPKDRARVLRRSAECWLPTRLGMGDPSKSIDLLQKADECGDIDPHEKCEILSLRAMMALWQGQFDVAEKYCTIAEESLEEIDSYDMLALQLTDHVSIYLSQGLVKEALEKAEKAMEAHLKSPSKRGELEVNHYLGVTHLHRGLFKEALECFDKSLDVAAKLGDSLESSWGHIYKGLIYDAIGDFEAAEKEAERSREHALHTESAYLLAGADAFLGHALIRLDRIDEAQEPCFEATGIAKSFDWRIRTPIRGLVTVTMAELHASRNADDESRREFQEAIELFRGCTQGVLFEAIALTWFGDFLVKRGFRSDAGKQYEKAIELYEKLGNSIEAQRLAQVVANAG
jgi:tetratricopeptide (TPR) repeat protein